MSIVLNQAEKRVFAEVFLEEYLSYGHGNMSKRDMDVLIFKILQRDLNKFQGLSNHLVAMKLRTTPSKVKNLIYESALRFPDEDTVFDEAYFKEQLKQYFLNPIFKVKSNEDWIYIQLDNPLLLDALKAMAKNNKEVIDGSFNSEIVKLSKDGFINIITELLSRDERRNIEQILRRETFHQGPFSLKNAASTIVNKCLEQGVENAPGSLTKLTNWLFDGQAADMLTQIQQMF